MILINSNESKNIILTYELYKKSVKATFEKLKLLKNQNLLNLISLFGNEAILQAIDSMRINYLGQIVIDEHTKDAIIARYLEFRWTKYKSIAFIFKK